MAAEHGPVRMTVEPDSAAAEPIRGFLEDGRGAPIEFAGWLELMSALDRARERHGPAESGSRPRGPEQRRLEA